LPNDTISISVIVTTFNRKKLLKETIDSILNQTYRDFELIIVDNYSNYDFIAFINSYKDDRISAYQNQNNGVIAINRNYGIKKAKGDYIAFCDDDDLWYSDKLMTIYKFISNISEVDVIGHDLVIKSEIKNGHALACGPVENNMYKNLLEKGNRFLNSGTVVRREFLLEHEIVISEQKEFISVEDYELWLQLAFHNARFEAINTPLGEYLLNDSNISQSKYHLNNLENMLQYHVFRVQKYDLNHKELWKKVRSNMLFKICIAELKAQRFTKFIYYFFSAFFASPLRIIKRVVDLLKSRLEHKNIFII